MRAINKQSSGGYRLTKAHANPPQNKDEARSRWSNYGHKESLRNGLLEEQFFLCCYSEIRMDRSKLGCHIEHVQPKSHYPQRTFDYQNLAVSALDSGNSGNGENDLRTFKAQGQETFGGHAKRSEYDPDLFVSCHQADCARFFAYLSDGRVVPAHSLDQTDQNRVAYTIRILNLNSPYLVTERRRWWAELDQLFEQHQQDTWSIEHLAAVDLVPTGMKLSQFFSTTRHFFGGIAEQVLSQYAPELV